MASLQGDEGVSNEQAAKLTQESGVLEEKPAISEEAEVVVHEGDDDEEEEAEETEEEEKPEEETEIELKEEENVGSQIIGEAELPPTFDDDEFDLGD